MLANEKTVSTTRDREQIAFGTDGWRGVIGRDFTSDNVRIVAQAYADWLRAQGGGAVAVGYDNRFLSERFAAQTGEILHANGIEVSLASGSIPTPALSFWVKDTHLAGGVMITASHNPPEFNGFKIKAPFGGSALPEMTKAVEERIGENSPRRAKGSLQLPQIDLVGPYEEYLAEQVDLQRIRDQTWRIIVDPLHGTGGRIIEHILQGGKLSISTLHANRDPYFGHHPPEPLPARLEELRQHVLSADAAIGIALDGDADRLALVDEGGAFVSSHEILSLLARHLIEERGEEGILAKTFSTTVMLDRVAQASARTVRVTPIGFKHITRLMLDEDVVIGGEESGGIGVPRYLPERDGTLIALLILELLARESQSLSEACQELHDRFGPFAYQRKDLQCHPDVGVALVQQIEEQPPTHIAGRHVDDLDTLDGVKLLLDDGSWILFRQSGTESVLRLYCEASSSRVVGDLLHAGEALLGMRGGMSDR